MLLRRLSGSPRHVCRQVARLTRVSLSENKLADSERLQLGRLVFDGADRLQLAKRHGLSIDDVDDAWRFCREHLSRHFADQAGAEYRLLNDQELKERALDCLRLLLDWRDALILQQRLPIDRSEIDDGELTAEDQSFR